MPKTGVANVSTWCCKPNGYIQLGVNIDKTAYLPGENAEIHLDVDNSKSMVGVKGVWMSLHRTVRLRDSNGDRLVETHRVNSNHTKGRVEAGQEATGANSLLVTFDMESRSGDTMNTATVRSQYIECIYTLNVQLEMDGHCMCCGQKPMLSREVTIYPVLQDRMEVPIAPIGWSPVVMQEQTECSEQPSAPVISKPEDDVNS